MKERTLAFDDCKVRVAGLKDELVEVNKKFAQLSQPEDHDSKSIADLAVSYLNNLISLYI